MASRISVTIQTLDKKSSIKLPVNPEIISQSSSFEFSDTRVTGDGEVTIPNGKSLKEINLESFFPLYYSPSYCEYTPIPSPDFFVKQIGYWVANGTALNVVITGVGGGIDDTYTIRKFEFDERAGNVGDVFYSLQLKQYRKPSYRVLTTNKDGSVSPKSASARTSTRVVPKTYTIKNGDSLWKIAQSVYGNGSRWAEIYSANKSKIGADKTKLKIGVVLTIP